MLGRGLKRKSFAGPVKPEAESSVVADQRIGFLNTVFAQELQGGVGNLNPPPAVVATNDVFVVGAMMTCRRDSRALNRHPEDFSEIRSPTPKLGGEE